MLPMTQVNSSKISNSSSYLKYEIRIKLNLNLTSWN